jgi:hypothetical protein
MEYDDQAWVAAANNIVVELAQTNSLLEKSIEAAEGSRAALEWMCSGLELFLQQLREFQALLFKELSLDPQMASDKAQMGPDEEEEDEEMENASGSEESGSGGDEGVYGNVDIFRSVSNFRYLLSELNRTRLVRIC